MERRTILILGLRGGVDMEDKWRATGRLDFQLEASPAGQRRTGWALEFRWDPVLTERENSGSAIESNVNGRGKGSKRLNRSVSGRRLSRSNVNNVKLNVKGNVSVKWRNETSPRVNLSLDDGRPERPRMRQRGRLRLRGREVTADYP